MQAIGIFFSSFQGPVELKVAAVYPSTYAMTMQLYGNIFID